jgi:hypothetical protein
MIHDRDNLAAVLGGGAAPAGAAGAATTRGSSTRSRQSQFCPR